MNVSSYFITFNLPGYGEAEGELIRIKAPQFNESFIRELPFDSRGIKRENIFIIPVNILYKIEKPTKQGKRGDILYDPKGKSLYVLLENKKFDITVAQIGNITREIGVFEKPPSSAGVRISKKTTN